MQFTELANLFCKIDVSSWNYQLLFIAIIIYACKNFSILIGRERCNFNVIPIQKSVIPVQFTKLKNVDLPCLKLDLNTFFAVYKHKTILEFVKRLILSKICNYGIRLKNVQSL